MLRLQDQSFKSETMRFVEYAFSLSAMNDNNFIYK